MEKAQYPQKTCREPIYNPHGMGYACELPDLHPGPHANLSVREAVERRDRWEENNPKWREKIGHDPDDVDRNGNQKEQE